MPITIPESYVDSFESSVRQLAQQKISRLRRAVTEVYRSSKSHRWERLAATQAAEKTSPRTQSPSGGSGSGAPGSTDGLTWSRRQTLIRTFHAGEIVEPEDVAQMLVDPNSASVYALTMAMNRQADDIIIEAATGNALDGQGNNVAFPASQTIGGAAVPMSLDLVLETMQKFYDNDIGPEEPKCYIISPYVQRVLLGIDHFTSSDFQAKKALATGYLPNWLGFDWIVSTRLLSPTNPTTDVSCLAMTKRALGLHIAEDIRGRAKERPGLSFAWQLYTHMSMDAVRVEDEHIVHVHCQQQ